jgi:hypothetical protein
MALAWRLRLQMRSTLLESDPVLAWLLHQIYLSNMLWPGPLHVFLPSHVFKTCFYESHVHDSIIGDTDDLVLNSDDVHISRSIACQRHRLYRSLLRVLQQRTSRFTKLTTNASEHVQVVRVQCQVCCVPAHATHRLHVLARVCVCATRVLEHVLFLMTS